MCPGGGLSAVIWTDFVQTILMIIGALWLMILSFREVGGYEELIEKYRSDIQKTLLTAAATALLGPGQLRGCNCAEFS